MRAAIDDVAVPTAVIGVRTTHETLLHGWSSAALTPLTLASGRAPERPGEVVLDAGLSVRLGVRVRLAAVEPARPFTVVGITRETLRRQSAVFVTDAEARRIAGHPRSADAIGLLLAPGADPVRVASAARRVAGSAAVLTGDNRGGVEFLGFADAREGMTAIMGLFGALALVIAVFVVAGTLGLAVQLREREIALLRVIAATPAQVRRMLRWEAILLALAAAASAYFPGAATPAPSTTRSPRAASRRKASRCTPGRSPAWSRWPRHWSRRSRPPGRARAVPRGSHPRGRSRMQRSNRA